jgi:flagellar motor switch protein FliM
MAARPYQVLDPRTMGRPVHLLGRFTGQAREDLSELFHTRLNRRYRARFEIQEVTLEAGAAPQDSRRWLTFGAGAGRINFALDRSVLLCILGYRYGIHANAVPAEPDTPGDEFVDEPETATEERLAARLGLQLVTATARCINSLQPESLQAGAAAADEFAADEFTEAASAPLNGAWTLQVKIVEHARKIEGSLWLRLEEGWIVRLLRGLAPVRERGKVQKNGAAAAQPLPARLQLTLVARLLRKEMTLGALLDLRIGDVIPITLGTTDVLIGDSRLFTASVAEHKGKLCLTSFEDME